MHSHAYMHAHLCVTLKNTFMLYNDFVFIFTPKINYAAFSMSNTDKFHFLQMHNIP